MILQINSDGGARGNPGPAASAFIIKEESGETIFKWSKYLGERTNNQAEYLAVVMALKWLVQNEDKNKIEKVIYKLDSELIVKQLKGEYKVKSKLLTPYVNKVKELIEQLSCTVEFQHIPRAQNQGADSLVNFALDAIPAVKKK